MVYAVLQKPPGCMLLRMLAESSIREMIRYEEKDSSLWTSINTDTKLGAKSPSLTDCIRKIKL